MKKKVKQILKGDIHYFKIWVARRYFMIKLGSPLIMGTLEKSSLGTCFRDWLGCMEQNLLGQSCHCSVKGPAPEDFWKSLSYLGHLVLNTRWHAGNWWRMEKGVLRSMALRSSCDTSGCLQFAPRDIQMKGRHQLWMALMLPQIARTFCLLSSMLPFRRSTWLPEQCRGLGCLGTEFPILCTHTPSTPLFFVLFFSQCVFINVAPSFYIHCLFTSPLAFLCSSFQHFLASSSHPYPPTYFLLPQAFLLLCALPTIFILYHPFCYHPTFFILLSFFFSTKHFLNIF